MPSDEGEMRLGPTMVRQRAGMPRCTFTRRFLGVVSLVVSGSCLAASEELRISGPLTAAYRAVADHLCSDMEYLRCLEVSARQCNADLGTDELRVCLDQSYIVRDSPGAGAATSGPLIPTGLVECIYAAHIDLRGLRPADVNSCMASAKLDK